MTRTFTTAIGTVTITEEVDGNIESREEHVEIFRADSEQKVRLALGKMYKNKSVLISNINVDFVKEVREMPDSFFYENSTPIPSK